MNNLIRLQKTLKDSGYKSTKTRMAVFSCLQDQPPQTMSDLIKNLEGKVDRVTIYRTIDLFERIGVVRKVTFGWKYRIELGDTFSIHHHHITCQSCGEVSVIHEDEATEKRINKLGQNKGYFVTSHQLELQGYCKRCKHTPTSRE